MILEKQEVIFYFLFTLRCLCPISPTSLNLPIGCLKVPTEWSHLISECCEVNRAKYKPQVFENTALHSTRITLGWDRTPAARTQWLREQFEPEAEPGKLLRENKAQVRSFSSELCANKND